MQEILRSKKEVSTFLLEALVEFIKGLSFEQFHPKSQVRKISMLKAYRNFIERKIQALDE